MMFSVYALGRHTLHSVSGVKCYTFFQLISLIISIKIGDQQVTAHVGNVIAADAALVSFQDGGD